MLTKNQRAALAREARRLAMKAASGKADFGPLFVAVGGHPACAIGQVAGPLWREVDTHYRPYATLFIYARSEFLGGGLGSAAYEFPLLCLADALEEAPSVGC